MLAFISGKSFWRSSLILVLAFGIDLGPSRAAAQNYSITDLGTLCDPSSECPAPAGGNTAFDVDNWGRVVGSLPWELGQFGCFRTAPNEPINPATDRLILESDIQGADCFAYGINDTGFVVGTGYTFLANPYAFGYGSNMESLYGFLQCYYGNPY